MIRLNNGMFQNTLTYDVICYKSINIVLCYCIFATLVTYDHSVVDVTGDTPLTSNVGGQWLVSISRFVK